VNVTERRLDSITPDARNPRKNQQAVATVKASLAEFGWQQPIVVDAEGVIIVGHTRDRAALEIGMETAPVQVAGNLTPAQARAYRPGPPPAPA
jgi:ParB-like chromosome segregation protein Spo0J